MRFGSLCFDFDSTIVSIETIDLACEISLKGRSDAEEILREFKRLTVLGMEGALPFDESLSRRMKLISLSRAHIKKIAKRMPEFITSSLLQHREYLKRNASKIYVVSGGFEELIYPVTDFLGIIRSHVYANAFVYDGDAITGIDATRPTAKAGGKAAAIERAAAPRPRMIVGDGWTDYEIKSHGVADVFVAFVEHVARKTVIEKADFVARSFDELIEYIEHSPMKV